ncbi:MAG TPA: hypothetical protein VH721_03140 [Gaiellaceae bacterium]
MPRLLSTAFLVALLAATTGAYAVTKDAKLELAPIFATRATTVFSPACDCDTAAATIGFRLRKRDRVTVWVERDGKRVRTLASGAAFAPGLPVSLVFDGITEAGLTLPDGLYRPVVHLARQHRTITLPEVIELDTSPPTVRVPHRVYTHISPDGDGRKDVFRVRYRLSDPGRAILLADGREVVRSRGRKIEGTLAWNGRFGGRTARPGPHVLKVTAEDVAGNRAEPFPFAVVTIRFVGLGRPRVVAKPGTHFAILVLSDAPRVSWLFNRVRGVTSPGTVRFQAPRKRGVYRLYVSASEHAARALVVVG